VNPELLAFIFAESVASMKSAIDLAEQTIFGNDLLDAMHLQLALDHGDQRVAGHCIELDALVKRYVDLFGRGTVFCQLLAQMGGVGLGRRGSLAAPWLAACRCRSRPCRPLP
jgi:hypothetical protein